MSVGINVIDALANAQQAIDPMRLLQRSQSAPFIGERQPVRQFWPTRGAALPLQCVAA